MSGYIRAIAAKLVLIDYMRTKTISGTNPDAHTNDELQGSVNKDIPEGEMIAHAKATSDELEFGLRCFSRAGRAILSHSPDAPTAYHLLSLSMSFWQAMISKDEESGKGMELTTKNFDEAFDSISFLPDAASLLGGGSAARVDAKDIIGHENFDDELGSPSPTKKRNLSTELKEFVMDRCSKRDSDSAGAMMVQRYLPCLARIGYKHGNRFARLREYTHSLSALRISLEATDRCIAHIRQATSECDSTDDGNSAIQIQEQEMIVVSRECLFVLSHVYQACNKNMEAKLCLDKVEEYIRDQRVRDDNMFAETMAKLKCGSKTMGGADSELSLSIRLEGKEFDQRGESKTTFLEPKDVHRWNQFSLIYVLIFVHQLSIDYIIISKDQKPRIERTSRLEQNLHIPAHGGSRQWNHLSVLLTGIQTLRQNISTVNAQKVSNLDDVAIDTAKVILTTLQNVCLSKSKAPSNSLFSEFAKDTSTQSPQLYLIREARAHYARGVSMYRPNDHVRCACWADMLIDILTLLRNFDCKSHDEIDSQVTVKQGNESAISELMGVKAYALAMCGNHVSAIMLELDGALSAIQSCTESPSSDVSLIKGGNELGMLETMKSILSVMPIIANACIKNETENKDIVLLGVQERWIRLLQKSDAVHQNLRIKECPEKTDNSSMSTPGGASLFCVLRAFLCNFEQILEKFKSDTKNVAIHELRIESTRKVLETVLQFISKVRDRKLSVGEGGQLMKVDSDSNKKISSQNTTSETTVSEHTLIWDDQSTNALIGSYKDCVWVAEQTWNIAVAVNNMSNEWKGSVGFPWVAAARLFAMAHDFALLSEEEEGENLTKGFLDCDQNYKSRENLIPSFDRSDESNPGCVLSSEFSAQCLLLSVANSVDAITVGVGSTEKKTTMVCSIIRINLAMKEFQLNCDDQKQLSHTKSLLAWLGLRCMIELGDDEACIHSLVHNELMNTIESSKTCQQLVDRSSKPESDMCVDGGSTSKLSQMYLLATRAEKLNMHETSKHLLRLCAKDLCDNGESTISVKEEIITTLGAIHRKLLEVASLVEETRGIFSDVDTAVKKHHKSSNNDISSSSSEVKMCYSSEELDWFTIEAYNRGLSLLFLSDLDNAKTFLEVALNLLPFCGKE
eukprot:scaffold56383_cov72-Attheya_sp.AAC.1